MLPSLFMSSPTAPAPPARPRGLWKGRGIKARQTVDFNADYHRPSKRHRSEDTSEADSDDGYYLVALSPGPSSSGASELDMDSEKEDIEEAPQGKTEEWEGLKHLFSRATEAYESDNVNESLRLLRAVLLECHRFLLLYDDPSVLYAGPRSKTPEPVVLSPLPPKPRKKCKCKESPVAFFAILGTTLFLLGNTLAQDASLALPEEPSSPAAYWLAALDVFEMGENLPSRTSGRGCEAPEDFRMAIVWGRTLLCVADAALTFQQRNDIVAVSPERKYGSPSNSIFAAIAARRVPASRRISLATAVPHDLLLLAMDHFTRGIFHMPHAPPPLPTSSPSPTTSRHPPQYSRAAELFTIGLEVLALAERLPAPGERLRWAAWADGVLNQIPPQAQTAPVVRARGRAWLVAGTASVEDIEAAGESRGWGAEGVLDTEDAEEAREGLERAVGFFERAINERVDWPEDEDGELRAFYAEALLTLANLTKEEEKREALYQRAQLLGGLTLEGMDQS